MSEITLIKIYIFSTQFSPLFLSSQMKTFRNAMFHGSFQLFQQYFHRTVIGQHQLIETSVRHWQCIFSHVTCGGRRKNRIGEQQHYNGGTTHYNNTFQHLLGVKVKGGSKPSKGIRHVPVTNRNKSCRSLSCMVSKPVQKRCTIGSVSTNRPLYLTPALYVQQNKRCEMKALKAPNHQT